MYQADAVKCDHWIYIGTFIIKIIHYYSFILIKLFNTSLRAKINNSHNNSVYKKSLILLLHRKKLIKPSLIPKTIK